MFIINLFKRKLNMIRYMPSDNDQKEDYQGVFDLDDINENVLSDIRIQLKVIKYLKKYEGKLS